VNVVFLVSLASFQIPLSAAVIFSRSFLWHSQRALMKYWNSVLKNIIHSLILHHGLNCIVQNIFGCYASLSDCINKLACVKPSKKTRWTVSTVNTLYSYFQSVQAFWVREYHVEMEVFRNERRRKLDKININ